MLAFVVTWLLAKRTIIRIFENYTDMVRLPPEIQRPDNFEIIAERAKCLFLALCWRYRGL
jgi:hypothetical protein